MLARDRKNYIKFLFVIPLFSFVILSYLIYYLLIPKSINVNFDNIISQNLKEIIKNKIFDIKINLLSSKDIYKNLKEDFNALEYVSISYQSSSVAQLDIKFDEPIFEILSYDKKQNFILTKNGFISKKNHFEFNNINNLKKIYIKSTDFNLDLNSADFKDLILKLEQRILDNYEIIWVSKTEIILKYIFDSNLIIIAHPESIKNNNLLKLSHEIFQNKKEIYKTGVKLDIRLIDRIICSPNRVGEV